MGVGETVMTFNGTTSTTKSMNVLKVTRHAYVPVQPQTITVPGKPGGYLQMQELQPRYIMVDIALQSTSQSAVNTLVRDMAAWLVTEEPKVLSFDDEANKQYYAILARDCQLEPIAFTRHGTLVFLCVDPFIYKTTEDVTALIHGHNHVDNNGNWWAYPRYEIEAGATISILRIDSGDGRYIQLGQEPDEDESVAGGWVQVVNENMTSLAGFTTGVMADGGAVSGTMATNGYTASPAYAGGSWGSGAAWHGPNIRKTLGTAITDFWVYAQVGFKTNLVTEKGRIEVYLLNAAGTCIGKIAMKDTWETYRGGYMEARAGALGAGVYYGGGHGSKIGQFASFIDGHMWVKREGEVWTAHFSIRSGQTILAKYECTWTDVGGTYGDDLKFIEVHIAQNASAPVPSLGAWINHLSAAEWVAPGATEVPIIAEDGDEIVIDCSKAMITKNGLNFLNALELGSDFWPLNVGASQGVDLYTDDAVNGIADADAYVRPRWL